MGLELKVSDADVKRVLTERREDILKAIYDPPVGAARAHVQLSPGSDYSPNLFVNSLIAVQMRLATYELSASREGFQAAVEEANLPGVIRDLIGFDDVSRAVHRAIVEGSTGSTDFDRIVDNYLAGLRSIVLSLGKLTKIEIKGASGKLADTAKDAVASLAMIVLQANAFYGGSTTSEFLAHVRGGVIDHNYTNSLLAAAGVPVSKVA